jgi:hypothetical protein
LVALANATHVSRAIVDQTNFPVRSKLLAAEIAETSPDLVGLQEVALWRSGPLQLTPAAEPRCVNVARGAAVNLSCVWARRIASGCWPSWVRLLAVSRDSGGCSSRLDAEHL